MFPTGTGIIHMDNVGCIGTESSLIDCPFSRDTSADTHGEDVGVICLVGEFMLSLVACIA